MAAIIKNLTGKQAILADKVKAQTLITCEFIELLNQATDVQTLNANATAVSLELAQAKQHPILMQIALKHGADFVNQCLNTSTEFLKSIAKFLPSTEIVLHGAATSSEPSLPKAQLEQITRKFLLNLFSQAETQQQIKYIYRTYSRIFHPDKLNKLEGMLLRVSELESIRGESISERDIYFKQLGQSKQSNELLFLLKTAKKITSWSQPITAWFDFVIKAQQLISLQEVFDQIKILRTTPSYFKKLPDFLKTEAALQLGERIILDISNAHQAPDKYLSEHFKAFDDLARELSDKGVLSPHDDEADKASCSSAADSSEAHVEVELSEQQKAEIEQQIIDAMTKILLPQAKEMPQIAEYRLNLLIDILEPSKKAPLPLHIQQLIASLGLEEFKRLLTKCKPQAFKKLEIPIPEEGDVVKMLQGKINKASTVFEKLMYKSCLKLVKEVYKTHKAGETIVSEALAQIIPFVITTAGTTALASLYAEEIILITGLSLFCQISKNPVINDIGKQLFYIAAIIPILSASGHYLLVRGTLNSMKLIHSLYKLYIKNPLPSEIVYKDQGSVRTLEFNSLALYNIAYPLLERENRIVYHHWFPQLRIGGIIKHPAIEDAIKYMVKIDRSSLSPIEKLDKIEEVLLKLKNNPKIYASKTKIAIDQCLSKLTLERIAPSPGSFTKAIKKKVEDFAAHTEGRRYLQWSPSGATTASASSSSSSQQSDTEERSLALARNP